MTRKIIFLLCALSLGGCMVLPSSDDGPVAIYALHKSPIPDNFFAEAARESGIMVIPAPGLPSGLETERIALYMNNGRRLDYYASARWADDLDNVLQDVIIQTGRHALPGMIVDKPDLNIPANYRLAITVNEFQPVYRAGPEAAPQLRSSMTFSLIQLPGEEVLTNFTIENGQQASSNHLSVIVSEMESLLQATLEKAYQRISAELGKATGKGTL